MLGIVNFTFLSVVYFHILVTFLEINYMMKSSYLEKFDPFGSFS